MRAVRNMLSCASHMSQTTTRVGREIFDRSPIPANPLADTPILTFRPTRVPSALALGRRVAPLAGPKKCLINHLGWSAYSSVDTMGGLGEQDPSADSPPSCRSTASRSLRHSGAATAVAWRSGESSASSASGLGALRAS